MIKDNPYGRPSYREVTSSPTGEMYIKGTMYLHVCTSYPPVGKGKATMTLFNCHTGHREVYEMDRDKTYGYFFHLKGVKIYSHGSKRYIPEKKLEKLPICYIKPDHSKSHLIKKGTKLRILHRWNDEWVMVRVAPGNIKNIFTGELIFDGQLTMF